MKYKVKEDNPHFGIVRYHNVDLWTTLKMIVIWNKKSQCEIIRREFLYLFMDCQMCKRKPAEQTGSHITSAFLLYSQIGRRGEEQAFLITTDPEQDYSINMGDKGIKEDFIFCRDCEKRLGFIENYYSSEITQKIEEERFKQNFPSVESKHGTLLYCKRINPIGFSLLIYSNIWRASLSNLPLYAHFKLPQHIEEEISFHLDLFLPEAVNHKVEINIEKWLKTVADCNDYFKFFPYIILKAEKLKNKTITFQFFDNVSSQPNHLIINEYIILPFFGDSNWKHDFFQFKNEVSYQDLVNDKYVEIKIGIISNERYLKIKDRLEEESIKQRIQKIDQACVEELRANGIAITPENIKKCRIEKVNRIGPPRENIA